MSIETALKAVQDGVSIRKAAKEHGVSHATLARHVRQGETPSESVSFEGETVRQGETVRHPETLELTFAEIRDTPWSTLEPRLPPCQSPVSLAGSWLRESLWMQTPGRYTELRVRLLGPRGTVIPRGDGRYGLTSALPSR